MALPEVCAVWIEQRVQDELETKGPKTSLRSIGRMIAAEVEKHFEKKVSPDMVRYHVEKVVKAGGNPPPKSQPTETVTNPPAIIQSRQPQGGGKRDGAGRKPNDNRPRFPVPEKTEPPSEKFKASYDTFLFEVVQAKKTGWSTTSQATAVKMINTLFDVATIK